MEEEKTNISKKEIVEFYETSKKNVLFIGVGGLGKTHQLFKEYESTKNALFINAKDIQNIRHFIEIKNFILNYNNVIFIDALNEGNIKSTISFLEKIKCKIIATTRGTFPIDKIMNNANIKDFFWN